MSQTVIKLHPAATAPRWQDRLAQVWRWAVLARQRAATRHLLGQLDDRMLSDIGISQAQAQFEAERPVWDLRFGAHR